MNILPVFLDIPLLPYYSQHQVPPALFSHQQANILDLYNITLVMLTFYLTMLSQLNWIF